MSNIFRFLYVWKNALKLYNWRRGFESCHGCGVFLYRKKYPIPVPGKPVWVSLYRKSIEININKKFVCYIGDGDGLIQLQQGYAWIFRSLHRKEKRIEIKPRLNVGKTKLLSSLPLSWNNKVGINLVFILLIVLVMVGSTNHLSTSKLILGPQKDVSCS